MRERELGDPDKQYGGAQRYGECVSVQGNISKMQIDNEKPGGL